jgi:hypothetical protein
LAAKAARCVLIIELPHISDFSSFSCPTKPVAQAIRRFFKNLTVLKSLN